jgi:hypothetical protein
MVDYFHYFIWPVKCVTIKIAIVIENGRSLKLCQTQQAEGYHIGQHQTDCEQDTQMPLAGRSFQGRSGERGRGE